MSYYCGDLGHCDCLVRAATGSDDEDSKVKRKRAKKEAKRDAKHNAEAQKAVGAKVRTRKPVLQDNESEVQAHGESCCDMVVPLCAAA